MLPHPATPDNPVPQQLLDDLQHYVRGAARQGLPAHEAELTIWRMVLAIGHAALGQFFDAQGPGDLGETLSQCSKTTSA
jgi:hypothetical protein